MLDKKYKYTILVLPTITVVAIINGIVSGITSVIVSYFFRPLWNNIVKGWKNDKID